MNNDHRKLRGTMKTKTERRKNRLLERERERGRKNDKERYEGERGTYIHSLKFISP